LPGPDRRNETENLLENKPGSLKKAGMINLTRDEIQQRIQERLAITSSIRTVRKTTAGVPPMHWEERD
jgi:hypothetical protein